MMISLSVVIITFNEEDKIGRCIDSVAEVADEVLVVDSFSTDRTEEICRGKKARFIQHKFDGYIEQKNFANILAKSNYILSLDADECLTEELQKNILETKIDWKYDGYFMNRFSNYCGQWIKHCGWYPDRKLRLFDRRKAHWAGEGLHEKIVMADDSTTGYLKGDILHYTIDSIEAHKAQIEKFTTISAKYMNKQGKKVIYITIPFRAIFKFFQSYILRLGFLDGYYGYKICSLSVRYTWLKYYKLWKLNKEDDARSAY